MCFCCKCTFCTRCIYIVFFCPSWVHTLRSASFCLPLPRIKKGSGILPTPLSLLQGMSVRHKLQQHHTLTLQMLVLKVRWVGHQHSPPETSSRWLQRLECWYHVIFSGFEVSPVPIPVPSEKGSSRVYLCSILGSVPSNWQGHCTLRCQRISPVASIGSSFRSW